MYWLWTWESGWIPYAYVTFIIAAWTFIFYNLFAGAIDEGVAQGFREALDKKKKE